MADFLFGSPGSAQKPIVYSGLQVSTSQYDLAVQWLRGQRRCSTNCIWTGDFQKHKQSAKGKGGGKGSGQYTYTSACILSLGFGEWDDPLLNVWAAGSTTSTTTLADLGMTFQAGTPTQTPWAFVVSKYPSQAQAYKNIANLTAQKLDLGSAASIPDFAFEGRCIPYADYLTSAGWTNPTTSVNTPGRDVNMADFLPDFLQDPLVGGGFDSGDIPDLTDFRAYQAAQGLFFSPYLTKQERATDIINRWAKLANTWIYWSNTAFVFVPLGDQALTANGYTYTPNLTVDCDLGPADFVSNPPVKVDVKDQADCPNRTVVSITDRTMGYVTNPIEYKAESLIRKYGRREPDSVQADEICNPAVGNVVSQLIGRRNANLTKTYAFQTSWRFVRWLPGSIFTLTDPTQDLVAERVRITSVAEDENGILSWTAEELPAAGGTYFPRTVQPGPPPTTPDTMIDAGSVNVPAVAEPAQAVGGTTRTVLIAASGGANFGGANVWISFDNWASQSFVGKIQSSAIQGVLTANLAAYGGSNPDTTNTLSVDATASLGEPEPLTTADADGLRSLSLVCAPPTVSGSDMVLDSAGELLAPGTESTTGTYTADLTYLQRGQLGTAPGAHSIDDLFTLFDMSGQPGSTIQFPLPAAYIGAPIWLKFAAFNLFGKNVQDLSLCQSYKYTPTGAGFGAGTGGVPAAPTGLTAGAGVASAFLSWNANAATDNVSGYDIYRAAGTGASFGSAILIAAGIAGQAYTDTGLAVATGYTYFLKAKNAIGLSAATAGVDLTTSATPLGDVSGPASSTDGDFALFNGTGGKTLKDTGLARDTDGTFAANSDSNIPSQKAVKTYVDVKVAGLSWKQAVRAATTVAGTLATSFENGDAIDGVTLATGDRILIKNQSAGAENGIYVVAASGAPSRSTDADAGSELVNASCYVSEGTTNADTQWTCTTNAPITPGSTSLAFAQLTTGGGAVSSVFGRTGAVVAATNDYAFSQISGQTTLAQFPSIADQTALGNLSGGAAVPVALTATQLTTLINAFGSSLSGAAPASGGGTANFLRADGSWAVPPGTATVPTAANPTATASDTTVNGSASTFLRSDGAPAVQKGSSSAFGIVKVDNSTITASAGVISATGFVPSAAAFHPGFQAARYYTTPAVQTWGTLALSGNRLYAIPFYVPVATTFTKMSISVTSFVALSSIELGVYANSSGVPGALEYDAGTVSSASNGLKEITGLAMALSAGWHWLAMASSSNPTVQGFSNTSWLTGMLMGYSSPGTFVSGVFGAWTFSAGALPNPFPTVSYNDNGANPTAYLRL